MGTKTRDRIIFLALRSGQRLDWCLYLLPYSGRKGWWSLRIKMEGGQLKEEEEEKEEEGEEDAAFVRDSFTGGGGG